MSTTPKLLDRVHEEFHYRHYFHGAANSLFSKLAPESLLTLMQNVKVEEWP